MLRPRRSIATPMLVVSLLACAPSATPDSSPPASTASTASASPSTAVDPTPAITSTPLASPTPVAVTGGWSVDEMAIEEPLFRPDGTVYVMTGSADAEGDRNQTLLALDPAGQVLPGWPVEEPPGAAFGAPAVAPDGSLHVVECRSEDCVLHRFGIDGRDGPGWPVPLLSAVPCPASELCWELVAMGPDGTAYVNDQRSPRGLDPVAIQASGAQSAGWPVVPEGRGLWWSNAQVGADGTLFLLGRPEDGGSGARLVAYGPDGALRDGWPVEVPDAFGYRLGPHRTVITWSFVDDVGELCMDPRRTVFTVFDAEGQTLPGWPRGSVGHASPPAIGGDGTVYYTSARGNVYAHDANGAVKGGWPVAVPAAATGCGPAGPFLAPDGTVRVLTSEELVALDPDGRARPGWPYRPTGDLLAPVYFDTDGIPTPVASAFGVDGTIHLVVFEGEGAQAHAEVVALDRDGRIKPGWPYPLPFDVTVDAIGPLSVSPLGQVFVRQGDVLVAIGPDGRASG